MSLNRKNSVPKNLQRRHERRLVHRAIKAGISNTDAGNLLKKINETPGVVLLSDPEEE